jgi:hypothetical protein
VSFAGIVSFETSIFTIMRGMREIESDVKE